jgi:hypothetical protein
MSTKRFGGCLCGAVRYSVEWPPIAVATCHCRNCQKQSGSALSLVGVLRRDALKVTGDLTVYEDRAESGATVYRKFCGQCGSPVITDTKAAEQQGIVFIKAGTLDDVSGLAPSTHYWTDSAQDWFAYPEGAVKLARQ